MCQHFSSDAKYKHAVRIWLKSNPEFLFVHEKKKGKRVALNEIKM